MNQAFALNLSFGSMFGALFGYIAYYLQPRFPWKLLGKVSLWVAWLSLTAFLGFRWMEAGRAPMSNMYESLHVLNWGILGLFLLLQRRLKVTGLGFWAAGLCLGIVALTSLMDSSIRPLVPALRSNWLIYHVVVIMLAYACLGLAALSGGLILACFSKARVAGEPARAEKAASLDGFAMRAVNLGFVLLTAGIALGSVWANEAWGSWWSWDPKETWSLITWFYYAVVIHLWRTRAWRGERLAWLNLSGAALVAFTYFGVNYLLSGLHSYGS